MCSKTPRSCWESKRYLEFGMPTLIYKASHNFSTALLPGREWIKTYVYGQKPITSALRLLAGRSCCYAADCSVRPIPPSVSLPRPPRRNLHQPPSSSPPLRMLLGALRGQHQRQAFEEARWPLVDAMRAALVDDELLQMDDKFRRPFSAPHV